MAPKTNPEEKIIKATLKLAAQQGWRELALADIAAAAKVSLATLSTHFPSKTAILIAYGRGIDAKVLDAVAVEEMDGESARDRLFDVLMMRFDALAPDKEALKRITADLRRDPVASAPLIRPALQSMGWMLEAACIDSSGLAGAAGVRGLALVWGAAFRVWLEDNEDQSKTMAELDRRLGDAAAFIGQVSRLFRKKQPRPANE